MQSNFKMVGYLPAWKMNRLAKVRYDAFNYLIYSFAFPDEENDMVVPNLDFANTVLATAHQSDVKVLLGVGGWDVLGNSHLEYMFNAIRDEATIDNVVSNICMTVDELTFDGVDISFGNPGEKHGMNDNINLFMQKLGAELKKLGKELSISVFGNKSEKDEVLSYEVSLVSDEIIDSVDFVNVINYELREGVRTNNTNLKFTNPFESAKKVPNNKAVFGIPFFFNMSLMAYRNSTELESMKGTDIVMCGSEAYFASDDALLQKTRWAKDHAAGINIWEMTQDFENREESLISKIMQVL